ncbi:MAG: T9SS type A sorting domain-containing protein [Candidatus Marinimicrobia bacterium]|nr:T9SS type A sorting domain-containing protein [Candidatus Neomarinimicrobiota bacterium]
MKQTRLILTFLLLTLPVFAQSNPAITPKLKTHSPEIVKSSFSNDLRICALRVSFQRDDNDATTGNGQFLASASPPCTDMVVDPPPHTIAYFKDHIEAVSNYYSHASNGNVAIDFVNSDVYPTIDTVTYLVSHPMDYYNPFLEKDSIDLRLAQLFVEAVRLADVDVNFSDYDVVVLFHAGVGQDFDLFLDPTPNDIPSAYMNQSDLAAYLESETPGTTQLLVDNGAHTVSGGIILPETQNHLLFPNWKDVFGSYTTPCDYQIGLNGTFAFMMGFYLGLPGLYNTETGETGVGKFGLMDQGSANLNGLIPSFPSAWEREFMGWTQPVIAKSENDVKLSYAESGADSTLWKVPVNDNEYFLVENRNAYVRPGVSLDSIQYKIYADNGEDEWPSLLPLIRDSINAVFSLRGVLLSVPKYDVGLPGSGLLIWHIDQSVIDQFLAQNKINYDREHRGVDLEEGDGAQDLGYESQLIGANVDIGWYFDPWFAGNEGFWDLNQDYTADAIKSVGFTDDTNPAAKTNDFARTGIKIDHIGKADSVISFQINRTSTYFDISGDWYYPWQISLSPPISIDLDITDSQQEFVTILDSIYLWNSSGNLINSFPVIDGLRQMEPILSEIGDTNLIFASISPNEITCWSVDASGGIYPIFNRFIAEADVINSQCAWGENLLISCVDSATDRSFLIKITPETDTDSVTILETEATLKLVGTSENTFGLTRSGKIYRVTDSPLNATLLVEIPSFPTEGYYEIVTGYLNSGDVPDLVLSCSNGIIEVLDAATDSRVVRTFPTFYPFLALSDIDGDQQVEIVGMNGEQIIALTDELVVEANFPIEVPHLYQTESVFDTGLYTSDVDGDGVLDILVRVEGVGILAFNYHGDLISGFPITVPDQNGAESTTLLSSDDGLLEIMVGDDDRIIGTLLSSQPLSENAWTTKGGNSSRNYFYPVKSTQTTISDESLLNRKKTFNWPNPVRGTTTAIRYFLNHSANLTVKIYDLAGDYITTLTENNPVVGDPGEISWNVSGVGSGVYLAVVKAKSGSKTESVIIKILVVK